MVIIHLQSFTVVVQQAALCWFVDGAYVCLDGAHDFYVLDRKLGIVWTVENCLVGDRLSFDCLTLWKLGCARGQKDLTLCIAVCYTCLL